MSFIIIAATAAVLLGLGLSLAVVTTPNPAWERREPLAYFYHGKIVLLLALGLIIPFLANNLALFLGYQAQLGRRIVFMKSPKQNSILSRFGSASPSVAHRPSIIPKRSFHCAFAAESCGLSVIR
jgi:uncharacterized BrkB/YihY/UPF0761 family membrane protein